MSSTSNIQTVSTFLQSDKVKEKFEQVLDKSAGAFLSSVITTISSNDMLKDATKNSVYGAALMAATLNLPLGLGQAYIVPFKKGGITEAQFQIGYKGLKQLAIRTGQFKKMQQKKVYEGQLVDEDSFIGYSFDWKAKKSEKVIGYASFFELTNGFESLYYMSKEECEAHAMEFSQSYKNPKSRPYSLWAKSFDKMAIKTVTKLHLNSGEAPLSVDVRNAIKADQGVVKNVDKMEIDYVDNQEDILPVEDAEVITEKSKETSQEDLDNFENQMKK